MLSRNIPRSMNVVRVRRAAARSNPLNMLSYPRGSGSSSVSRSNGQQRMEVTNTNTGAKANTLTNISTTNCVAKEGVSHANIQTKSKFNCNTNTVTAQNKKIMTEAYKKHTLSRNKPPSLPTLSNMKQDMLMSHNNDFTSQLNYLPSLIRKKNFISSQQTSIDDDYNMIYNHNNIMNLIMKNETTTCDQTLTSQEFYTTMHNVLMRTTKSQNDEGTYNHIMSLLSVKMNNCNMYSHSQHYQWNNHRQYREYYHYHEGTNKMINHRHFSTTGASSSSTSKSDEPTNKTNTDRPTISTTTTKLTDQQIPPSTLKKDATLQEKASTMLKSIITSISSFLAKIPSVLWFYITHPTEFRQKLIDLKEAAKKEAHHYYMGSKLLMADVKIAKQMLGRLLQGSTLTRRERKQLIRTVTDVFRIVPMSIFVLIPFMEFALPFALKIFPNMLPSTFQDSLKAEENMKRELKSRIAMAEFFQETLQDLAKGQRKTAAIKKETIKAQNDNDSSSANSSSTSSELESTESREETAASFLKFIEKARKGEFLPPEVIIRYSAFFKDELTLHNMPRMQLINMCKYMSIPPYGNDHFLRFQLRHKVRVLQEDDQRILWEGIDSLTKMELREACQERGMRSTGLSKEAYKRSLQQWIDLSVNRNVPISLLIMSRTFFLREEMTSRASLDTDGSKSVAGLADAISGLQKEVVNEVILESVTPEDKKHDAELMKLKLEVLEHQNELIKEEKEQRLAEEAKKAEQALEKQEAHDEEKAVEQAAVKEILSKKEEAKAQEELSTMKDTTKHMETEKSSTVSREEPTIDSITGSEAGATTMEGADKKEEEEEEKTLSSEEIDAISQLVSPDPVSAEREKLQKIKEAMQEEEEEPIPVEQTTEGAEKELGEEYPSTTVDDIEKEAQVETFADEQDKAAAEHIAATDEKVRLEADSSTTISFEGEIPKDSEESQIPVEEEDQEIEYTNVKLDKAITRLKSKVENMVGNIEIQLSDVEEKIGNKLHFLDKDMDGILSRQEMAICLQSVLKRPLTSDEAMAIAANMDENEDGYFSLEELSKWLETNKILKLVEEGRDAEVDKIIAEQANKTKDDQRDADAGKVKDGPQKE